MTMGAPYRTPTPETEAVWGRALVAWERDEWTTDDLARLTGVSRRTVQRRLGEARERREEAHAAGTEPPEIDEATWLELVSGLRWDRPSYDLDTDETTHDGTGETVVVAAGPVRSGPPAGRHRHPQPPAAGQRLIRRNLSAGREQDRDTSEPESEGYAVNRADAEQGVRYVQRASRGDLP